MTFFKDAIVLSSFTHGPVLAKNPDFSEIQRKASVKCFVLLLTLQHSRKGLYVMFVEYALTVKLLLPSCGASTPAYTQTPLPYSWRRFLRLPLVEAILPSVRIIGLGVREL